MNKYLETNLTISSKINHEKQSIDCPFLNECSQCSVNSGVKTCPKQVWNDEKFIMEIGYPDNCPMSKSNILVIRQKVLRRANTYDKELKAADYELYRKFSELHKADVQKGGRDK